MTTDDRTTPPPPDAVDHAAAIQQAVNHIHIFYDDEYGAIDHADDLNAILNHAAALDAARIAAEAKLAAERERVARLQAAFIKAESRVELWEANQDQTYEIWVQRWGLHPDDLYADPARRDRDARGGEA